MFGLKNVYALTQEELENQKVDIENKINQANTEIAGIKEEMTQTLEQINRLNVQIKEQEDEIEENKIELEKVNKEVEAKKIELEEAQANYDKQKKILEKRLISMYEASKTTYLDVLVGSNDFSDFLSKYYLLKEIAKYDKEIIGNLDKAEKVVENENSKLEEKQDETKRFQERLETKQKTIDFLIKDKNNLIGTLSAEELEVQNELEQFEQDKKQIEEELKEIARRNAIKYSLNPSESGYISPLLGKTRVNITTGYYGYSGHTGVDFAIASGTEVMAVKSGTVVISNALKNANGKYRSYGEYVAIDHHDGTITLYAHGLPNSRKVQVNDEVVAGQVIMLSGSTGNSTGPHLHFEVRVNRKVCRA